MHCFQKDCMMQKLGGDDLGGELRFSNYGGKKTYNMFNLLKGFITKNSLL